MWKTTLGGAAMLALVATQAGAAGIDPTFTTFGDLSEATFGGTGIPTDPTAFSTFTLADGTLTLGLTAHQRFFNDPLTNDGAGTFNAVAGLNDGDPSDGVDNGSPSSTLGATWNFAWYANFEPTPGTASTTSLIDLAVKLFYDLDPAVDNEKGDLGVIDISGIIFGSLLDNDQSNDLDPLTNQSSQNPAFSFLASGFPGVTPPGGSFDPFAGGEYSFLLESSEGSVAMNVNVSPVPVPAALPLLATALAGLGLVSWRRKRTSAA